MRLLRQRNSPTCQVGRRGRRTKLAKLLFQTGHLGEAEQLMRRALEICETTYSAQHPTVANPP